MAFYKKKIMKKDNKKIESKTINDYASVPIVPPKKVMKARKF